MGNRCWVKTHIYITASIHKYFKGNQLNLVDSREDQLVALDPLLVDIIVVKTAIRFSHDFSTVLAKSSEAP